MVISELLRCVQSGLCDNAAFEARQIVMRAVNMNETGLIINAGMEVSAEDRKSALEMLKRRKNGEPLQYILGTAEFMSFEFEVNESTLIPRSDTETLVETVLEGIGEKRVKLLDIGTGTGCIGISIARLSNAEVTLADISDKALCTAKRNALKNGVTAQFLKTDILSEIPDKAFDVIVSNPPYIETEVIKTLQTEVRDYEPLTALDGGEDGLRFYRRLTKVAPELLNENGFLAFEIGYKQGEAVSELMRKDFDNVRVIKDLCGNDRVVIGYLKE